MMYAANIRERHLAAFWKKRKTAIVFDGVHHKEYVGFFTCGNSSVAGVVGSGC